MKFFATVALLVAVVSGARLRQEMRDLELVQGDMQEESQAQARTLAKL